MDKSYFLGIDTSNYRTSAAVCDADGNVVVSLRRLLDVKQGEAGLRQSEALFAHTKALPELLESLGAYPLAAVGYSAKPRDVQGSYMPCFLAGASAARAVAALCGIPAYPFSHQAGHIEAALYSCQLPSDGIIQKSAGKFSSDGRFLTFHLSGGTTEALLYDNGSITLLGGTLDLNAGQVIDRVGVALGLKFPCGEELERLAGKLPFSKGVRVSVKGFDCNLAGAENLAKKLLAQVGNDEDGRSRVAAFALDTVLKTVDKMTENLLVAYPGLPVLYAGGVMACGRMKRFLSEKYDCAFALPEYSGDNAAGTARLCRRKFFGEKMQMQGISHINF